MKTLIVLFAIVAAAVGAAFPPGNIIFGEGPISALAIVQGIRDTSGFDTYGLPVTPGLPGTSNLPGAQDFLSPGYLALLSALVQCKAQNSCGSNNQPPKIVVKVNVPQPCCKSETPVEPPVTPTPTPTNPTEPTVTEPTPTDPTSPNPTDPTSPNPTDPTSPNPTDPTSPNPTDPTSPNPTDVDTTTQNSIDFDFTSPDFTGTDPTPPDTGINVVTPTPDVAVSSI